MTRIFTNKIGNGGLPFVIIREIRGKSWVPGDYSILERCCDVSHRVRVLRRSPNSEDGHHEGREEHEVSGHGILYRAVS
jgi:hypothetical protein